MLPSDRAVLRNLILIVLASTGAGVAIGTSCLDRDTALPGMGNTASRLDRTGRDAMDARPSTSGAAPTPAGRASITGTHLERPDAPPDRRPPPPAAPLGAAPAAAPWAPPPGGGLPPAQPVVATAPPYGAPAPFGAAPGPAIPPAPVAEPAPMPGEPHPPPEPPHRSLRGAFEAESEQDEGAELETGPVFDPGAAPFEPPVGP